MRSFVFSSWLALASVLITLSLAPRVNAATLGYVTVASTNLNRSLATTGDTLTFTAVFTGSGRPATGCSCVGFYFLNSSGVFQQVGGFVGSNTAGVSQVSYTITDSTTVPAGNLVVKVTYPVLQTLVTADLHMTIDYPVVIERVQIQALSANPAFAKVGTTVRVTVTVNKLAATPPSIIIAGSPALVNQLAWGTKYNYSADHDCTVSDPAGFISFSVAWANLTTPLGVSSGAVTLTSTTDGSSVNLITTPPLVYAAFIASSSQISPTVARPGDTVTLLWYTSGPIFSNSVSAIIAGKPVVVSQLASSPYVYQATYTMTAADPAGVVPFEITVSDPASQITTYSTPAGSPVTFFATC